MLSNSEAMLQPIKDVMSISIGFMVCIIIIIMFHNFGDHTGQIDRARPVERVG